MIMLAY